MRADIEREYGDWSAKGFRVLGLAIKQIDNRSISYSRSDEKDLTLAGFLLFFDPPKPDVQEVITDLAKRGVQLKIITGDNDKVARHVAEAGLTLSGVLTGGELDDMRDEALWHAAERTNTLCGSRSQPERTHHPCPAENKTCGWLYGRRDTMMPPPFMLQMLVFQSIRP